MSSWIAITLLGIMGTSNYRIVKHYHGTHWDFPFVEGLICLLEGNPHKALIYTAILHLCITAPRIVPAMTDALERYHELTKTSTKIVGAKRIGCGY